jgi:hypothetical protein
MPQRMWRTLSRLSTVRRSVGATSFSPKSSNATSTLSMGKLLAVQAKTLRSWPVVITAPLRSDSSCSIQRSMRLIIAKRASVAVSAISKVPCKAVNSSPKRCASSSNPPSARVTVMRVSFVNIGVMRGGKRSSGRARLVRNLPNISSRALLIIKLPRKLRGKLLG